MPNPLLVQTLKAVGTAGMDGVTVKAPTAVEAILEIVPKQFRFPADARAAVRELKRQGLLTTHSSGGVTKLSLTSKGLQRLQKITIDSIGIQKPKTWDKKWRIILFDVPVRYNKQRHSFTNHLKEMGFVSFRRSAWIIPYPCFDQVKEIAEYYNVSRYLTMIEFSKIDQASAARLMRAFPDISF